jgi:hypothetical protein
MGTTRRLTHPGALVVFGAHAVGLSRVHRLSCCARSAGPGDRSSRACAFEAASWGEPSELSRSWTFIALADAAGDVAERFDLRAYDAVHLASAMVVDDGSIVVVTWDRAPASAAGLDAAPPV